jgi:HK97 gp10 family phage protein
MNVNMDYKQALNGMITDVLRSGQILESAQEALLTNAGKIIKKEVREIVPKSNEMHTHLRDDIKVSVRGKKRKTGVTGVSVYGGDDTWRKWHLIDDGTRNPDGSVHTPALHFSSKAMEKATPKIESLVNDLVRKVTEA